MQGKKTLFLFYLPLNGGQLFTLLHSEWPKLYRVLTVLSAIRLRVDLISKRLLCCCCVVVLRPGKHLRSCRDGQLT